MTAAVDIPEGAAAELVGDEELNERANIFDSAFAACSSSLV